MVVTCEAPQCETNVNLTCLLKVDERDGSGLGCNVIAVLWGFLKDGAKRISSVGSEDGGVICLKESCLELIKNGTWVFISFRYSDSFGLFPPSRSFSPSSLWRMECIPLSFSTLSCRGFVRIGVTGLPLRCIAPLLIRTKSACDAGERSTNAAVLLPLQPRGRKRKRKRESQPLHEEV